MHNWATLTSGVFPYHYDPSFMWVTFLWGLAVDEFGLIEESKGDGYPGEMAGDQDWFSMCHQRTAGMA